MVTRCVVPTGNAANSSCYGNLNGTAIDYTSGACIEYNQSTQVLGDCPHWISLCFRQ
jgi:hypothetical protein